MTNLDLHPILDPLLRFDTLNLPCRPPRRVFPYNNPLLWWVRGGHRHLVDGIEKDDALVTGPERHSLRRRLKRLKTLLLVRAIIMVPLSISIVSSIVALVREAFGLFAAADAAFSFFARVSTSFATVFVLLYLLANRILAQLQADVLVLIGRNTAQAAQSSNEE